MNTLPVSPDIRRLLNDVTDKRNNRIKHSEEYYAAQSEERQAVKSLSAYLHELASHSDDIADQFFTEEGVMYQGQLFIFDDEGELFVSTGPSVVEVGA